MATLKSVMRYGAAAFALLPFPGAALAQQASENTVAADAPGPDDKTVQEIIVTGTLIRGVAPVGTNVIGLDKNTIVASGATTTNELLARIPQVANFFNTTPVTPSGAATTFSTPQIRGLPTLILIDGHRVTGAGTTVTGVDPSIIPPSVLERVEVLADGGSSLYGSDAVGGVINFTTRKRFDGVQAHGVYGFADDYRTIDADVTVGRDWDDGSIYASYAYSNKDAIFGRDRNFIRQIVPTTACAPGTIGISNVDGSTSSYALPTRAPGTAQCDETDGQSYVPKEERHSVFAGLSQRLNDAISIDIRGFYTSRITESYDTQLNSSGTITDSNPFFVPIGSETSQTVSYSYASVLGASSPGRTKLDQWGVTPMVTADLGGGFELRALGNYSRSFTSAVLPRIDTTAQSAALASTSISSALNPYDLSQTNTDVIEAITGGFDTARAKQEQLNARAVIDGALFALPGGDLRIAVGTEIIKDNYNPTTQTLAADGSTIDRATISASRTVKAVFGEVIAPLIDPANDVPAVYALNVDVAGRYDHYSDFGGTFNPKFGASYQPVEWITVRGNWGKSFVAPSLADSQAVDTRVDILPNSFFLRPGDPVFPNLLRPTILLAGGNPGLKPQKATTWSAGVEIRPTFAQGLKLNANYYNVDYKDQLSIAPFFNPSLLYTAAYSRFVTLNPTLDQALAATQGLRVNGASSIADAYGGMFGDPYVMIDARRQNLARVKTDGLDFSAQYQIDAGFGSIDASTGGTYVLSKTTQSAPGALFYNTAKYDMSRFNLVSSIGATISQLKLRATWNHTAGYKLTPDSVPDQTRVSAYDTVDLFLGYDFKGQGALNGVMLTLNVNNVFNQDPPFLNVNDGYAGGNVIGRYIQIGLRKDF